MKSQIDGPHDHATPERPPLKRPLPLLLLCLAMAAMPGPARADGDPARGRTVYNRCAGCHATTAQNKAGPHLVGLIGRRAGGVEGFRYSRAMAASQLVWTEQTLDAYLAAPTKAMPGTSKQTGLPDARDRADLIAYLKTLGAPP